MTTPKKIAAAWSIAGIPDDALQKMVEEDARKMWKTAVEDPAKEQGSAVGRLPRGKTLQLTGDHSVKLYEAMVPCSSPEADR
ncbi:UNVERIFIED_CONTAM: hypothetical protein FKN15_031407 [Acipenser sinensis]